MQTVPRGCLLGVKTPPRCCPYFGGGVKSGSTDVCAVCAPGPLIGTAIAGARPGLGAWTTLSGKREFVDCPNKPFDCPNIYPLGLNEIKKLA